LRAIAACASLILAIAGTAFMPTTAQASLACSFDVSGSRVGTQVSGDMRNAPLVSCYFGYTGPGTDFGFTGFSTTNNQDFSGNTAISSPPAVGFDSPTPNNFEAKPTTLASTGNHAVITFNALANSNEFDNYQFTVLGTELHPVPKTPA
jgi:hypothetical protein